ncbi:MAG: Ig-like domain-containing protein, partial [Clostridia bacterium]|nr:Ig-like domain-containing protein [Clostridia bacterium]
VNKGEYALGSVPNDGNTTMNGAYLMYLDIGANGRMTSDLAWAEATNEGKMISAKKFPVTYEVSDPAVISVDGRGIITPLAAGSAEVKVTIAGEMSFRVKVEVREE